MRNNSYLSLINFKVKLQTQRLFFMNEHYVGSSIFFNLNFQHRIQLQKKLIENYDTHTVIFIQVSQQTLTIIYHSNGTSSL